MLRSLALASVAAAVVVVTGGYYTQRIEVHAAAPAATAARTATPPPVPAPGPTPAPTPVAVARSTAPLQAAVAQLAAGAEANAGVALVELGGDRPLSWSYNGDTPFVAASTYKLPLLMAEAQLIASGAAQPADRLCFTGADYEDGWFDDYGEGSCYTRQELAARTGQQSDNTAAHILVSALGGASALNAYASAQGATESQFYDPNHTTASDLARLWVSEASGRAGGATAQQWLYPLLTRTAYESGIPAGTPPGTTVVHKIGTLDAEVNDAALVLNGPAGPYVVVVLTDGPGGSAGWQLVERISAAVWQFEAARG